MKQPFTLREKSIIAIAGIIIIGIAFVFFILGEISIVYNGMQLLSSIPEGAIGIININFNESVFAEELNFGVNKTMHELVDKLNQTG